MRPLPMFNSALGALLLPFTLGQLGCANQLAFAPPDLQVRAVAFAPPSPGKVRLYVFREGGLGRTLLPVVIDGVMLGSTMHHSFLETELLPGAHIIASPTNENVSAVRLEVSEGQTYFVKLSARWGWRSTRSALAQVDETEGREAISHSRMVQTISP